MKQDKTLFTSERTLNYKGLLPLEIGWLTKKITRGQHLPCSV